MAEPRAAGVTVPPAIEASPLVALQTWRSSTGPMLAAFDFRIQFPTTEDAAAYLDAATSILSEQAASGLTPVNDPRSIGEDRRHDRGTADASGQTIEFENDLFHIGPMVAKVFVAGVALPDRAAVQIAQSAPKVRRSLVDGPRCHGRSADDVTDRGRRRPDNPGAGRVGRSARRRPSSSPARQRPW